MSKSKNDWKIILCFIDGEPYLYNKESKKYITLHITPAIALELVKNNLNVTTPKRPNMREVWQIIAINIHCCDGYSSYFKKCTKPNANSFENVFTKKVTDFLNEFYPTEVTVERAKKRREYEKYKRKNHITSENAKRNIKIMQMTVKKGRKLY